MKILDKMKKEPRMILAVINFISFFLPWVSLNASGSTEVFGEVISTGEIGAAVTGFGIMEYSSIGIICYMIPIILFVLPLMKSTKKITHYLYILLPIIAIILMFLVSILVGSAGGQYTSDFFSVQTSVHRMIGFWIAGICNIAVIVWTAVKDFHIKSKDDLKKFEKCGCRNYNLSVFRSGKRFGKQYSEICINDLPQVRRQSSEGKENMPQMRLEPEGMKKIRPHTKEKNSGR